jgi:molecular chaperone GrpE
MSEPHNTQETPAPTEQADPAIADPAIADPALASDEPGTSTLVAGLQAQVTQLQDQALRAAADAQNARRRAEEEISKARKYALESFAESLLPVIDSLEAGLSIQQASLEQIRAGSEATLRQLKSALEHNKVIAIDPAVGVKFDPAYHQAISMVPADQQANTVVSVLQKGYAIAERVLRPALVTVSAPK